MDEDQEMDMDDASSLDDWEDDATEVDELEEEEALQVDDLEEDEARRADDQEEEMPQVDDREADDVDADSAPPAKKKEILYYHNTRKTKISKWPEYQKLRFTEAFKEIYANEYLGERGFGQPLIINERLAEKIAERIPYRSAKDVKDLIRMNAHKAKFEWWAATDSPIGKWAEVVDALAPDHLDLCRQLGNIMKVIQEEPTELSTEESDASLPQPDYNKLYEYLHCAITKKELPELSPVENLVVEECMQSIVHEIECMEDPRLGDSLRKVYLHLTKKINQYQEDDYLIMRKKLLHNANVYNPLGLNYKAVVPSTHTDVDR